MKRSIIIARLADIGRNPFRLEKLSDDQLQEVEVQEASKLIERKAHLERVRLQRLQEQQRIQRMMKLTAPRIAKRRAAEQALLAREAKAEEYRQERMKKPLAAIPTLALAPGETRAVVLDEIIRSRHLFRNFRRGAAEAKKRYAETGDQKFAFDANSMTAQGNAIQQSLKEDYNVLV